MASATIVYYWLRDDTRSDPEILGYLKAENANTPRRCWPRCSR